MEVAIYEDDARVGEVDLDVRSFGYDGDSAKLRELLERMGNDKLTRLQPVADDGAAESDFIPDKDEADHRPGMEECLIEGKALGRYLRQSVKSIATNDTPMRVEPVDGSLGAETITLPRDNYSDNESGSGLTNDRESPHFGPPEANE